MKQRVAKMNSEQPDAVISIHQNSYTDSSVKGAQVFYYEGSKEGKMLAELLQKSLIDNVDPLLQGFHQFFLVCGTYQQAFFFRV